MEENKKFASVAIIENSEKQLLLLKRNFSPFGWCLPGGKVDPFKETFVNGLIRELKEELDIDTKKQDFDYVNTYDSINGLRVNVYKLKYHVNKVKISDEHSAFMFTKSLEDIDLAGHTLRFLEKYKFDIENFGRAYVFEFGKYKGLSVKQVLEFDPQYIVWMQENTQHSFMILVLNEAKQIIKERSEELVEARFQANSERIDNNIRRENLKNAVETPYGMAISSNNGDHSLIDSQGNDTGEIVHWYYGWNKGSYTDDI